MFIVLQHWTDKFSLSVSGGTGESKGKKKQNVVPLQISEILEAPEEGFLVEGQEVGMMVIVGKVMDCEKATTKTTYKVTKIFFIILTKITTTISAASDK